MHKNFTSFLLFAFAVLLANACYAISYNKKPDASFNAGSDFMHVIKPPSANVNEQTNKATGADSDYQLWIKNRLGERYYHHYLQNVVAKKNTISDKKN